MIIILFVTFCSAPFRALLVSHENIVYISIIDVLDAIFKVILVTLLPYADHDKLIMYGYILLLMQIFNFTAFSLYSFRKYTECILPKISLFSRQYIRELLSYAGWVMYGMGCVVGRSQGIAIVLNRFLGTIANAAYGLGFQISSAVSTISIAFLNAMRPQIVKSEGAGNRKRALRLSCMLCKFSFFLLSALCVPLVFEMPQILGLWLKDIPQYTILFARMALIAGMVDTFTLGLSVTNEAVGNIRNYNITISSMKLITLPATWICLHYDLELVWVAIFYIVIEFISAFSRIPFIYFTAGLNITAFLKNNCLRVLMPMALFLIANVLIVSFMNMSFIFVILILLFFYLIGPGQDNVFASMFAYRLNFDGGEMSGYNRTSLDFENWWNSYFLSKGNWFWGNNDELIRALGDDGLIGVDLRAFIARFGVIPLAFYFSSMIILYLHNKSKDGFFFLLLFCVFYYRGYTVMFYMGFPILYVLGIYVLNASNSKINR